MTGSKPGLAKRFFQIIWQWKAVIGLTVCVGMLVCLAAGSYLLYSRYEGLKSINASLVAENSSLNEELEAVNSETTVLKAEAVRQYYCIGVVPAMDTSQAGLVVQAKVQSSSG